MEKIEEIPGGRGSNAKPSGTENPVGWGGQTRKTLRGGGMDIFWNHTMYQHYLIHMKKNIVKTSHIQGNPIFC